MIAVITTAWKTLANPLFFFFFGFVKTANCVFPIKQTLFVNSFLVVGLFPDSFVMSNMYVQCNYILNYVIFFIMHTPCCDFI